VAEQKDTANIAIIGAGILGTALAYILSSLSNVRIILLEQEKRVGAHTSSRNTGKVHAPFIYNPLKKKKYSPRHRYMDIISGKNTVIQKIFCSKKME